MDHDAFNRAVRHQTQITLLEIVAWVVVAVMVGIFTERRSAVEGVAVIAALVTIGSAVFGSLGYYRLYQRHNQVNRELDRQLESLLGQEVETRSPPFRA